MIPLIFAAFLLSFQASAFAAENPLYKELSSAKEVKVFVAAPTDPSGTKLDPEGLRKQVDAALKARKSIHFAAASSEAEARLKVETEIKGFVFSETDPVDMLIGVGMAAADAAKQDHFASMEALMTVRDASGSVRWQDTIRASLTDATMTEAEAREKILERAAEVFVREAFGKKR